MREKMRKTFYVLGLLVLFLGLVNCNYNGEASIRITNIGGIATYVSIENAYVVLEPGEYEIFEISWPGHGTMTVNFLSFPIGDPEAGENIVITINDGDEFEYVVEYYPE
jgi:hypothetical protein